MFPVILRQTAQTDQIVQGLWITREVVHENGIILALAGRRTPLRDLLEPVLLHDPLALHQARVDGTKQTTLLS